MTTGEDLNPRRRKSDDWKAVEFTAHDIVKALIILVPCLSGLAVAIFQVGIWVSSVNRNIEQVQHDLNRIERRLKIAPDEDPKIDSDLSRKRL